MIKRYDLLDGRGWSESPPGGSTVKLQRFALIIQFDMQIATSLLPRPGRITSTTDVAVVIDVLRATSVMATALAAGAAHIVTCREVAEAKDLASRLSSNVLLCGERGCQPIEGFDLGNSPAEYVGSRVGGKRLVLTTTNGTRAIEAAADAAKLITASFLNLSAVIESLAGSEMVHLVCAGTEGEITAEDVLLAGALLSECETRYAAVSQDDDSILARQLWQSWFSKAGTSLDGLTKTEPTALAAGVENDANQSSRPEASAYGSRKKLALRLRETRGGRNLVRLGYEKDLERCAAIDSMRAVPMRISRSPTGFELQAN